MRLRNLDKVKILFAILSLIPIFSGAQIRINSPYSRFGLGWIVDSRFETRNMAMGGIRYGVQGAAFVNPANPASYAAFDSASFVLEAGLFGTTTRITTEDLSDAGSYISMSHIMFGIPVTSWWRTSFGLLPFSYVGYDVYSNQELENIGNVQYVFAGSGGLNQVYWGNGFRVYKGLYAGFNVKYLFGRIDNERGVWFPEDIYVKTTEISSSFNARDFFFDIGLQYKAKLKEKLSLTMGIDFGPEVKMKSRADYLVTTYYGKYNSAQIYIDTIEQKLRTDGYFIMPTSVGTGFVIEQKENWLFGADFSWQNWKEFEFYEQKDSLLNSWTIAAGGELIPDIRSLSYSDRMSYRLGGHFTHSYLNLEDTPINEFGISFGLGFPIRRTRTTMNITMELGKMGTTRNDLIQESFARMTLGINIFETWFLKSKYY